MTNSQQSGRIVLTTDASWWTGAGPSQSLRAGSASVGAEVIR
jgi:hypothetical protein